MENRPVTFEGCLNEIPFKAHAMVAEWTDDDCKELGEVKNVGELKEFLYSRFLTPDVALRAKAMMAGNIALMEQSAGIE